MKQKTASPKPHRLNHLRLLKFHISVETFSRSASFAKVLSGLPSQPKRRPQFRKTALSEDNTLTPSVARQREVVEGGGVQVMISGSFKNTTENGMILL